MSGHPRTHQNAILRTYAGLLLISICVYTLMYAPQPMFNSVSRDFGVDKGSTGLLVSVFMLSLAVSPLCVGMLLSRIGVRRAILGASLLLGISGVGIWFAPSFLVLLGIRALQALLVPVVLTAVMSGIAVMFRHLDLNRALAGYVTSNLVGSLCGRIIGGWAAQMFGWRATLAVICFFFFLVLLFIRSIPEMRNASARLHSPREYLAVFKGRGVPSLFFAEACGIFVFAAIGNLIPFRMAELGQGHSEGLIGLMYFGYSVGLVASLSLAPLMRVFKTPTRLILFASAVYVASCLTLAVPSLWALFGGLWLIAFGEFVVHSISPGLSTIRPCSPVMATAVWSMGFFFPVIISAGFSAPTSPELSIRGSAGLPATSVFNSSRLPRFSFCSDCTGRHLTCGRTACPACVSASGCHAPSAFTGFWGSCGAVDMPGGLGFPPQ